MVEHRDWNREERDKKKLVTKTSWYRPDNAPVPATPFSKLRNTIQKIVTYKTLEPGMSVWVIENQFWRGPPTPGLAYSTTSPARSATPRTSWPSTKGSSGSMPSVHRLSEQEADIINKNSKIGMAKHLTIFHKENVRDLDSLL